jgi:1-acyl-sn-glycerol-3-phosphate acyltransferase
MDHLPYCTPPRWWAPCPNALFLRIIDPWRKIWQHHHEGVAEVEIQGLHHLRDAIEQDCGVVITSNHAAHQDPFVYLRVCDALGRHCYYMVAWQSFQILSLVARRILQRHGCFTVDREGNDVRAFRQAVEVVRDKPNPLVLFAEGEVYHHYEHISPFRIGAAAIALAAARRAGRPVVCVPAAITYRYLKDPTPDLARLVNAFERKLQWRPQPHLPLAERIYRLGQGVLAVRERQYLGYTPEGRFAERAESLLETILERIEARRGIARGDADVPDRATRLRRLAIQQKEAAPPGSPPTAEAERDLHGVYVAIQLYSYLRDYQTERPTLEHLAEIVDKFEEDLLGVTTAIPRANRRGFIRFGPPVPVKAVSREDPRKLTATLEANVRELLGKLIADCGPWRTFRWRTGPELVSASANSVTRAEAPRSDRAATLARPGSSRRTRRPPL